MRARLEFSCLSPPLLGHASRTRYSAPEWPWQPWVPPLVKALQGLTLHTYFDSLTSPLCRLFHRRHAC
jgi:hypothetical protein